MATSPKPRPRRKPGHPSKYTAELGATICARLAEGESMSGICRDVDMPDRRTVLRWLVADTEFCRMYARARELGADVIAETAVAEAIAPMGPEDVQRARLAFDARKWWVAKLAPRRYSDRVQQEVSGPGGGPVETREAPPSAGAGRGPGRGSQAPRRRGGRGRVAPWQRQRCGAFAGCLGDWPTARPRHLRSAF
jgi:hypothetical protein